MHSLLIYSLTYTEILVAMMTVLPWHFGANAKFLGFIFIFAGRKGVLENIGVIRVI